jgi:hypothetical protein
MRTTMTIYAAEGVQKWWRELSLLGFSALAASSLVGIGQVGLALAMAVVNGTGVLLLLCDARRRGANRLAPRWPKTRVLVGVKRDALESTQLQALADASEALLLALAEAPVALAPRFAELDVLCRRVVKRGLALRVIAQSRQAELSLLDQTELERQLASRRRQLLEASNEQLAHQLTETVEALSERLAICAAHRAAIARIDAELEAATQSLAAAAARGRHVSTRWQELSLTANSALDDGEAGTRATRSMLRARLGELDSAIHELDVEQLTSSASVVELALKESDKRRSR